jgi:beta-lactamase superfamily II metal-dependent hydrolase
LKQHYVGLSAPAADETEIHVFGRGYGEALAIHIGHGKWIAVDSAITTDGRPWLLEYFDAIGVSCENLEGLFVTHWHTDHVRGASEILASAPNAKLLLSIAGKSDEFFDLIARCSGPDTSPTKAAAFEMFELFNTIGRRKRETGRGNFQYLGRNTVIKFGASKSATATVLAPSELDCAAALKHFARLSGEAEKSRSPFIGPSENHASVVFLLDIEKDFILLGADRENHADPERGWNVVVDTKKMLCPVDIASVFKIAHHGSETGFCGQ